MSILVIAEAGINHNGDMKTAQLMIGAARKAGVNIFKTQVYDVDKLFPDKKIIAQGKNWYEEVKQCQLTRQQVWEMADMCEEKKIEFMASFGDLERLSWLEEIGVKRHKIGFSGNRNQEFIDALVRIGKPILISCRRRTECYTPSGSDYSYLYCIPKYPTELSDLKFEQVEFPHEMQGFSDHTVRIEASMIAMSRGAQIIEKHFCLKRDNSNPDMVCSCEPHELKALVKFARKVEETLK